MPIRNLGIVFGLLAAASSPSWGTACDDYAYVVNRVSNVRDVNGATSLIDALESAKVDLSSQFSSGDSMDSCGSGFGRYLFCPDPLLSHLYMKSYELSEPRDLEKGKRALELTRSQTGAACKVYFQRVVGQSYDQLAQSIEGIRRQVQAEESAQIRSRVGALCAEAGSLLTQELATRCSSLPAGQREQLQLQRELERLPQTLDALHAENWRSIGETRPEPENQDLASVAAWRRFLEGAENTARADVWRRRKDEWQAAVEKLDRETVEEIARRAGASRWNLDPADRQAVNSWLGIRDEGNGHSDASAAADRFFESAKRLAEATERLLASTPAATTAIGNVGAALNDAFERLRLEKASCVLPAAQAYLASEPEWSRNIQARKDLVDHCNSLSSLPQSLPGAWSERFAALESYELRAPSPWRTKPREIAEGLIRTAREFRAQVSPPLWDEWSTKAETRLTGMDGKSPGQALEDLRDAEIALARLAEGPWYPLKDALQAATVLQSLAGIAPCSDERASLAAAAAVVRRRLDARLNVEESLNAVPPLESDIVGLVNCGQAVVSQKAASATERLDRLSSRARTIEAWLPSEGEPTGVARRLLDGIGDVEKQVEGLRCGPQLLPVRKAGESWEMWASAWRGAFLTVDGSGDDEGVAGRLTRYCVAASLFRVALGLDAEEYADAEAALQDARTVCQGMRGQDENLILYFERYVAWRKSGAEDQPNLAGLQRIGYDVTFEGSANEDRGRR